MLGSKIKGERIKEMVARTIYSYERFIPLCAQRQTTFLLWSLVVCSRGKHLQVIFLSDDSAGDFVYFRAQIIENAFSISRVIFRFSRSVQHDGRLPQGWHLRCGLTGGRNLL